MNQPKVYIVILNYMNWWDTLECLEAVLRLDYENYQIIVLDNNSPNNSIDLIKLWLNNKLSVNIRQKNSLTYNLTFPSINKNLEYIFYDPTKKANEQKIIKPFPQDKTNANPLILFQNKENKGYANGNNIAIDFILSKNEVSYVMILNPDTILTKNSIKKLVDFSKDKPKTIIGSVIKDYYNPDKIRTYGGCQINKKTASVKNITDINNLKALNYISGNVLFTNIYSFKEIGLIPEEYFLFWEETDWCTQAKLKGYNFEVCLDSIVFDKEASSVGRGYLAEYYFMLSSLKYFKKHYQKNLKYIVFFHILRLLKRIMKKDYEKARALKNALIDFVLQKKTKNR